MEREDMIKVHEGTTPTQRTEIQYAAFVEWFQLVRDHITRWRQVDGACKVAEYDIAIDIPGTHPIDMDSPLKNVIHDGSYAACTRCHPERRQVHG